ncbi:hypothetical protein BDA99DRAFT_508076 [Phascolomyces articulosus]|uniref:Uncharacterized protein n=1 Tax=Phascolomyces articulosus TaxID=60185 RepID=A0AAD5KC53_9FUNG|nr:hypothetical protein BDA99DRAFT_508076 [Phascolomyces articulosus]
MDPPDDNGTKLREIKQMHRIYGNACYTVAMVPEVHIHNRNDFDTIHSVLKVRKAYVRAWADIGQTSLWWKHSRVLEETLASKRILVIGTDTHIWQDNSSYTCNMFTIGDDDVSKQTFDLANQRHPGRENVNQASTGKINNLQASSKQQHDIFPLVNIMSKNIEKIDYKINTKIAFHHFYRTMAIYDLSMLCFGSNYHLNGSTVRENTMKNSYKLPSWTGVFGLSIPERVTATTTLFESSHFICDGMLLHIPTKYYKTLSIIAYSHGCFTPLSHNKQQRDEQVAIFHKRMNATGPYNAVEGEETVLIDWAIQMKKFSHCYATHYYQPQDGSVMQARPLSLTEDCKKCIILPILFKSDSLLVNKRKEPRQPFRPYFGDTHDYYLPVLKKITYRTSNNTTEERFKVVGIYFLGSPYFGDLISSGDLENILHSVFGNDTTHDEVKEFIIQ